MRPILLAVGLAALLAACALPAPPTGEALHTSALPNLKTPAGFGVGAPATTSPGAVRNDWLASFADPQLDALVREALAYNPDLQVAAARVEQAAALVTMAGALLYPQVNVSGRASAGADSGGVQGIGLFLNWELDLWGRVRAGRAAAQSQYTAAQQDAEYARQSLAALVAKSWFLTVEARQQKATAEEMAAAAERQLGLTQDRLRVGVGDQYDVAQASASSATYRDSVIGTDLAYQQALRALELLAGRYPAAALPVAAQLPPLPPPAPVGLPSELLERRLDVVAAERRVAAAFYREAEAQAARLPRISLIAAVNTISSDVFVLKERDNPVWSAGGTLLAPLFLGGQLQAQVELRSAEQTQALAEYGRIGARAFGEVENALAAEFALAAREQLLRQAVVDNARALELATIRYRIGSIDLRAVQSQTLALAAARSVLLRVQSEQRVQRVNLHLALGGGFEPAAARAPLAAAAGK